MRATFTRKCSSCRGQKWRCYRDTPEGPVPCRACKKTGRQTVRRRRKRVRQMAMVLTTRAGK